MQVMIHRLEQITTTKYKKDKIPIHGCQFFRIISNSQ
jgi:hypothetical protein